MWKSGGVGRGITGRCFVKKITVFFILFILAGCTGSIRYEGSAEIANKIAKKLDFISKGYADKEFDAIAAHMDSALAARENIRQDIDSNDDISLDITIGRFIISESSVSVYVTWNRKWRTVEGNPSTLVGSSVLFFDPDTLLLSGVQGDDIFSSFAGKEK